MRPYTPQFTGTSIPQFIKTTPYASHVLVSCISILCTVAITTLPAIWKRAKKKEEFNNDESYKQITVPNYAEANTTQNQFTPQEEIIYKEQLSRNAIFLGEEGMERLKDKLVIIVGCGGVGSHAAHMLLRSGITNLRLVDFDQVTLSSLNRHASALRTDVGTPKVIAIKKHLLQIIPHANIDARIELFEASTAEMLLQGSPDYVVDCIDHVAAKVELLRYCHAHEIKVVSSMGASQKSDPTNIQISDISETREDPLARVVRKGLSANSKPIYRGILCVFSTEKPRAPIVRPCTHDTAPLPGFRAGILPVLGPLPAIFGNCLATIIIEDLAGWRTDWRGNANRNNREWSRMHRKLATKEQSRTGSANIPISVNELEYLVRDVWRGRSAISGDISKLELVIWDYSRPLTNQNVVLMNEREATEHESRTAARETLDQIYRKETLDTIDLKFKELNLRRLYR